MYIPEFWCGVVATVIFEVAVLIGCGIYFNCKKKGEEDDL